MLLEDVKKLIGPAFGELRTSGFLHYTDLIKNAAHILCGEDPIPMVRHYSEVAGFEIPKGMGEAVDAIQAGVQALKNLSAKTAVERCIRAYRYLLDAQDKFDSRNGVLPNQVWHALNDAQSTCSCLVIGLSKEDAEFKKEAIAQGFIDDPARAQRRMERQLAREEKQHHKPHRSAPAKPSSIEKIKPLGDEPYAR